MGRRPCCDKANVKRGPWSREEDEILKNHIHTYGTGGNWIALPKKAGLRRCGKSCRLRWMNYLRPGIKHGDFTEEEDNIICSLYHELGSRWSIIASQLPERTDNEIKNYWNTKLKKKLRARTNAMINGNPNNNNYNSTTLNFQLGRLQPRSQQVDHHMIFNQFKFQAQPNESPQSNIPTSPWHESFINNNLGNSISDFSGYCCPPFNFVGMETYKGNSSEINGNNNMSAASASSISNSPSLGVDNNIISILHKGGTIDECVNNNVSMDFGSEEFCLDMINEFLLGEGSSS